MSGNIIALKNFDSDPSKFTWGPLRDCKSYVTNMKFTDPSLKQIELFELPEALVLSMRSSYKSVDKPFDPSFLEPDGKYEHGEYGINVTTVDKIRPEFFHLFKTELSLNFISEGMDNEDAVAKDQDDTWASLKRYEKNIRASLAPFFIEKRNDKGMAATLKNIKNHLEAEEIDVPALEDVAGWTAKPVQAVIKKYFATCEIKFAWDIWQRKVGDIKVPTRSFTTAIHTNDSGVVSGSFDLSGQDISAVQFFRRKFKPSVFQAVVGLPAIWFTGAKISVKFSFSFAFVTPTKGNNIAKPIGMKRRIPLTAPDAPDMEKRAKITETISSELKKFLKQFIWQATNPPDTQACKDHVAQKYLGNPEKDTALGLTETVLADLKAGKEIDLLKDGNVWVQA